MLKIDFFYLSYVWLCIKRIDISLPLTLMRIIWQEAFEHEIIKLVLRTYSDYLISYFQGVVRVNRQIKSLLMGNWCSRIAEKEMREYWHINYLSHNILPRNPVHRDSHKSWSRNSGCRLLRFDTAKKNMETEISQEYWPLRPTNTWTVDATYEAYSFRMITNSISVQSVIFICLCVDANEIHTASESKSFLPE